MANSVYRNLVTQSSNITSLYSRLNTLRSKHGLSSVTTPSLSGSVIATSAISNTFSSLTSTKSASAFLSSVSLPYTVTVGSQSLINSVTSIAQLEKNLQKLEEACLHNSTDRSVFSTSVTNPIGGAGYFTVCSADRGAYCNPRANQVGDCADKSVNDVRDYSYDYGDAKSCYDYAQYTDTAGCGVHYTGFVKDHNFGLYHNSRASFGYITFFSTNKKANITCFDFGSSECTYDMGDTRICNVDFDNNCAGNYSSNWGFDNTTNYTSVNASHGAAGTYAAFFNTNFTSFFTANYASNHTTNFASNNTTNFTIFNSAYAIEGVDF